MKDRMVREAVLPKKLLAVQAVTLGRDYFIRVHFHTVFMLAGAL